MSGLKNPLPYLSLAAQPRSFGDESRVCLCSLDVGRCPSGISDLRVGFGLRVSRVWGHLDLFCGLALGASRYMMPASLFRYSASINGVLCTGS